MGAARSSTSLAVHLKGRSYSLAPFASQCIDKCPFIMKELIPPKERKAFEESSDPKASSQDLSTPHARESLRAPANTDTAPKEKSDPYRTAPEKGNTDQEGISSSSKRSEVDGKPSLSFEDLKSRIDRYDWNVLVAGKIAVFYSGLDSLTSSEREAQMAGQWLGKSGAYYDQNTFDQEKRTPARYQAYVFMAQRELPSACASSTAEDRLRLMRGCFDQASKDSAESAKTNHLSRERVVLDLTPIGREIAIAEKAGTISPEAAKVLWRDASEQYAKAANANSFITGLPCVVFGRNTKNDSMFIRTEFPQLKDATIFTDSTDQIGRDQRWLTKNKH